MKGSFVKLSKKVLKIFSFDNHHTLYTFSARTSVPFRKCLFLLEYFHNFVYVATIATLNSLGNSTYKDPKEQKKGRPDEICIWTNNPLIFWTWIFEYWVLKESSKSFIITIRWLVSYIRVVESELKATYWST